MMRADIVPLVHLRCTMSVRLSGLCGSRTPATPTSAWQRQRLQIIRGQRRQQLLQGRELWAATHQSTLVIFPRDCFEGGSPIGRFEALASGDLEEAELQIPSCGPFTHLA